MINYIHNKVSTGSTCSIIDIPRVNVWAGSMYIIALGVFFSWNSLINSVIKGGNIFPENSINI